MKFLWLVPLVVAACAAPAPVPVSQSAPSAPTAMPRGVVWTDGHSAVRVGSSGVPQCGSLTPAEAAHALARTNQVRAQAGLAPLRTNAMVQRAAQEQACDMARRATLTHKGTTTSGPTERVVAQGYRSALTAENIAAGSAGLFTLDRTVSEWTKSPGHHSNVVLPPLRDFGIGRAFSADGRMVFWAAVYAQPR